MELEIGWRNLTYIQSVDESGVKKKKFPFAGNFVYDLWLFSMLAERRFLCIMFNTTVEPSG